MSALKVSEPLNVEELLIDDGQLLGGLLSIGLIEDSARTFNLLVDLPWATREEGIAASSRIHEYIAEVHLSTADLRALVRSRKISSKTKSALLVNSGHFVEQVDQAVATDLVQLARAEGAKLSAGQILGLVQAGAKSWEVAELLGLCGNHLSGEEVISILERLEHGEYRKLSVANGRRPRLEARDGLEALLRRLVSMGYVSSFRLDDDRHFRVSMKRS